MPIGLGIAASLQIGNIVFVLLGATVAKIVGDARVFDLDLIVRPQRRTAAFTAIQALSALENPSKRQYFLLARNRLLLGLGQF